MNRRGFLKLPMAGAVLLPAAAIAKQLAVPEDKLEVVEAWAAPAPKDRPGIELIATFPSAVVSMTVHQGKLYVATAQAVYLVDHENTVSETFKACAMKQVPPLERNTLG